VSRLYTSGDADRVLSDTPDKDNEPFRSPWRRDYARLIHSASFRRLQGKTQVFPGYESDFFRNRLTHSLEVAQIAKSIAIRLNATSSLFRRKTMRIEPEIAEFAGLAHDLGHPPFGHNGEEALDECMRDFGGFEGNAQSLRIVSRLEKKDYRQGSEPFGADRTDLRCGLNLTYRSLASLLKYDNAIPIRYKDRELPEVMKGYYWDDAELVKKIKKNVLGAVDLATEFKTIECSIMDIADDIAYSTYDLEDIFKAGLLTPLGLLALDDNIYESVADTIRKRTAKYYPEQHEVISDISTDLVRDIISNILADMLFRPNDQTDKLIRNREIPIEAKKILVSTEVQALSRTLANDGHQRIKFTSSLVQQFIEGIEVIEHPKYSQLHKVRLEFLNFLNVEVLKNITYYGIIRSTGLQVSEYRGKDIVHRIFEAIAADGGTRLLPDDFRSACKNAPELEKMRTICDFIAGMTDRYAFEFYGRLYGTNHLTIHKPI
jgi:dGTPase